MADSLSMFGYDYSDVVGFKAKTTSGDEVSFVHPQGELSITNNGSYDCASYAEVTVSVPTSGGSVSLQEKSATPAEAEQVIVADSAYDGLSKVTVGAIPSEYIIPSGSKSITVNGTSDVTEFSEVSVNVQPSLQSKTATPSESEQVIDHDTGYDGLSSVTVGAVSSTYVGSGITRRTSLGVSGKTVTAQSGYYADDVSTAVAETAQATPSVSVSASGLITASVTQPEGYVAAGTKTATEQLDTQAAITVTPTTSSQTVGGAGKYMTGAITVNAIPSEYITTSDATATASDINSGETAYVNGVKVTGTQVIQHYYTGSSAPSSSLGSDGDIYLQS